MKRARLKPKGSLRSRVVQEFLCNGETGKKSRVLGNCEEPGSFFSRGHRHFLKKKSQPTNSTVIRDQGKSGRRRARCWDEYATLLPCFICLTLTAARTALNWPPCQQRQTPKGWGSDSGSSGRNPPIVERYQVMLWLVPALPQRAIRMLQVDCGRAKTCQLPFVAWPACVVSFTLHSAQNLRGRPDRQISAPPSQSLSDPRVSTIDFGTDATVCGGSSGRRKKIEPKEPSLSPCGLSSRFIQLREAFLLPGRRSSVRKEATS